MGTGEELGSVKERLQAAILTCCAKGIQLGGIWVGEEDGEYKIVTGKRRSQPIERTLWENPDGYRGQNSVMRPRERRLVLGSDGGPITQGDQIWLRHDYQKTWKVMKICASRNDAYGKPHRREVAGRETMGYSVELETQTGETTINVVAEQGD